MESRNKDILSFTWNSFALVKTKKLAVQLLVPGEAFDHHC